MIKKKLLGISSIAVVTVGALILLNGRSVSADDDVSMKAFNDLKAEVELLKVQLNETNDKIAELTNSDVTINQKINEASNEITINVNDIKILKTNIENNTHRISNITNWQIKVYDLLGKNPGVAKMPYTWKQLEDFRKSQQ